MIVSLYLTVFLMFGLKKQLRRNYRSFSLAYTVHSNYIVTKCVENKTQNTKYKTLCRIFLESSSWFLRSTHKHTSVSGECPGPCIGDLSDRLRCVYVTVSLQRGQASQTDVNGLICNPVCEWCQCVGGSGVICQLPQAKHAHGYLLTLPQTHTQKCTHGHTHAHIYRCIHTDTHTDRHSQAQPIFTLQSAARQPIQSLTKLFVVCLGLGFFCFMGGFVCRGVFDLELVYFLFIYLFLGMLLMNSNIESQGPWGGEWRGQPNNSIKKKKKTPPTNRFILRSLLL